MHTVFHTPIPFCHGDGSEENPYRSIDGRAGIADAMQAAGERGCNVYLPSARYDHSAPIVLRTPSTGLRGEIWACNTDPNGVFEAKNGTKLRRIGTGYPSILVGDDRTLSGNDVSHLGIQGDCVSTVKNGKRTHRLKLACLLGKASAKTEKGIFGKHTDPVTKIRNEHSPLGKKRLGVGQRSPSGKIRNDGTGALDPPTEQQLGMRRDIVELPYQLNRIGNDKLGRGGGRGSAAVCREIAKGKVGFVSNCRNDGNSRCRYGTHECFVVERPKVLD